MSQAVLEVLRAGLQSSVQDLGRPGLAALGVGRAGAMDPTCARLANWLAGNDDDAAVIEVTLSGPCLRFGAATTIACCGGEAELRLDGAPVPAWRPVPVARGSLLDCGPLRRGAYLYLAVAGGIAVEPVLGSRSVDLNAGLGPCDGRALQAGDRLPLAERPPRRRRPPAWSLAPRPWFDPSPQRALRLLRGSHSDALDAASQVALVRERFRIAARSSRVATHLEGPLLRLEQPLELISAAVTRGTLQLPPGGRPLMLAAEHPTTGGYPRIAHLVGADQGHLAQRRPGDSVLLQWIEAEPAEQLRRRHAQALQRLREMLLQRLRE